jgi:hypothetical protein
MCYLYIENIWKSYIDELWVDFSIHISIREDF